MPLMASVRSTKPTAPAAPARERTVGRADPLRVRDLTITFGDHVVVDRLELTVREGEFIAMVGPSGCGKSTTLNAISGLLKSGDGVRVEGAIEVRDDVRLAYAFQRDALLPWCTARRNVEVGAELAGVPRDRRADRARELLRLVGLHDVDDQYPHQLSGGMRQRVALARVLAYEPDVVLLDEPFGALDAFTRMNLQNQLLEIWNATGATMVLVTHDLAEALILGTRVVVLGAAPGRVHEVVSNGEWELPRRAERMRSDAAFLDKYRRLWDQLIDLGAAGDAHGGERA
jgi:NitT/TauT family transport system ATP-binding protein